MAAKLHTIALCGYAGVGKDTVAQLLCAHAGFRAIAFADALRREVADAYRIDIRILTERETKSRMLDSLALHRAPTPFVNAILVAQARAGMPPPDVDFYLQPRSPRQILQWWGTEYRRAENPHYWVRRMQDAVDALEAFGENRFVITDLRFAEEHYWLTGRTGYQIWQVRRPGITSPAESGEGAHSSATDGSEFGPNLVINNLHDVRHLQHIVLSAFVDLEHGLQNLHPAFAPPGITESQAPYLAEQGHNTLQAVIDEFSGARANRA